MLEMIRNRELRESKCLTTKQKKFKYLEELYKVLEKKSNLVVKYQSGQIDPLTGEQIIERPDLKKIEEISDSKEEE